MRRRIVTAVLGIAGAALVSTTGVASAESYCADGVRAAFAGVQLWRDANCHGGSVIVPAGDPSPSRPNFAAFRNYDGRTYNVDNNRSSLAAAPGTCVRVYDGANYTGEESNLLCATPGNSAFGLFKFNERVSSLRVCPADRQDRCNRDGGGGSTLPPATSAPPPVLGGFPVAWSGGPVNAPAWRPAKRRYETIRCGSRSIPANLPPQSVTRGWTPRTQSIADIIRGPRFGWRSVGGAAAGTSSGHVSNSYHYCGRAIDAFAPGVALGTRASGAGLSASWQLANWAAHNAAAFSVSQVIFYDRIWTADRGGWRPYNHPSRSRGNTLQHRDHVHISVY